MKYHSPLLSPIELKKNQATTNCSGKNIGNAHAPYVAQGLVESHFDVVMEPLKAILEELGIEENWFIRLAGLPKAPEWMCLKNKP